MALVISAYDIVIRVDAYRGGISELARRVPNNTFCCDDAIALVSFMNASDRDHFARSLDVPADAVAFVEKRLASPGAEWLERGTHTGVDAVWLRETQSGPLVVPLGWSPASSQLVFGTWEEMKEHLEFVGVEGNVEVYVDKRTGKKLYAGRTRPVLSSPQQAEVTRLRAESSKLLQPILSKVLNRQELGFFDRRRRDAAAGVLKQILAIAPSDGGAHWLLGMLARSGNEHAAALEHFRQAYESNPENPDVGREYAGQCLMLGDGPAAVRLSRELHRRFPDDIGLHSNLALALLIGGDIDEALATAAAAHNRDPSDMITRNLRDQIIRVKNGQAPRPKKI